MDVTKVLPFHFKLKLSKSFNKRHTLNISNCTSKLWKKSKYIYAKNAHYSQIVFIINFSSGGFFFFSQSL